MPAVMAVIHQLTQLGWDENSITEEELWKARMQVRGQAYLASDSIQTRVSRLATQQFYFGHPLDENDLLASIDAVDLRNICEVAARVIGGGLQSISLGVTGGIDGSADSLCDELHGLRDRFARQQPNLI